MLRQSEGKEKMMVMVMMMMMERSKEVATNESLNDTTYLLEMTNTFQVSFRLVISIALALALFSSRCI